MLINEVRVNLVVQHKDDFDFEYENVTPEMLREAADELEKLRS